MQESLIVLCVFRSTVWVIRKLTLKEVASSIDIPQGNTLEALVLASLSDDDVMSRLLELPLVKALQFSLAVTIRIGCSNGTKVKADENILPLPPV